MMIAREKLLYQSSTTSITGTPMSHYLRLRYEWGLSEDREHRANVWQLLDICVKNCGYPFHLQISTKEFLNELVRRFPERPPVRLSRVQLKILEAIEEWRQTICRTSRYKKDLGYICDMHSLLSYKGYMFPEIRREDAAVLSPSEVRGASVGVENGH